MGGELGGGCVRPRRIRLWGLRDLFRELVKFGN